MGKEVVEVIYGKKNKYEIVKETGMMSGSKFFIRKNGSYHKGRYSDLSKAVEVAQGED